MSTVERSEAEIKSRVNTETQRKRVQRVLPAPSPSGLCVVGALCWVVTSAVFPVTRESSAPSSPRWPEDRRH